MAKHLTRNLINSPRGALIAELAICIPVFVFLIFAVITINDQIQQRQKLNGILRPLSVFIVQECYIQVLNKHPNAKNCLEVQLNNTVAQVLPRGDRFGIIITNFTPSANAIAENYQILYASDPDLQWEISSRLTMPEVSTKYQPVLSSNGTITIIEVFIKDPHTSFLFRQDFFGTSDLLYDVIAF